MAYNLQLPDGSKIHPVIHVSQPKKAIGAEVPVEKELPPDCEDVRMEQVPVDILQDRVIKTAQGAQRRVLVQWASLPQSMATWEGAGDLQRRFPSTLTWGQASFQGGRMLALL